MRQGEEMPITMRIIYSDFSGTRKRPRNLQKNKNSDAIFLSHLFPFVFLFSFSLCLINGIKQSTSEQ